MCSAVTYRGSRVVWCRGEVVNWDVQGEEPRNRRAASGLSGWKALHVRGCREVAGKPGGFGSTGIVNSPCN